MLLKSKIRPLTDSGCGYALNHVSGQGGRRHHKNEAGFERVSEWMETRENENAARGTVPPIEYLH